MGYYTRHNLNIHQIDDEIIDNNETLRQDLEKKINKAIEEDDNLYYTVGSVTEDWICDDCKWYNSRKDMIEFSKSFPNVVFELEELGESHEDMWKSYFKNGKYQECKAIITYEDYDPNKLKEED